MPEVGQVAKMGVSCIRNFIIAIVFLVLACVQVSFAGEHDRSITTNVLAEQATRQSVQQDDRGRRSLMNLPSASESLRHTPGVCGPSLVQDDAETRQRWSSAAGMLKVDEQRQALVSVLLSHRTSILVTVFGLITTVTALLRRRRH